jgi:hypothetical protein
MEFILEGLNNTIDMTTTADLEEGVFNYEMDVSATATIDIKLTDAKKIFRYIIDASDIDDLDNTDTQYYVKMNNWPENLILNPAHAILEASSNEFGTYEDRRNMVKHDFVRYLAKQLFGTHKGVDLFTNEAEIKYDIAKKSHETSWIHIKNTLDNAYKSESQPYFTNADVDATNNFTKDLLLQIIDKNPSRLSSLSSIMNNNYFSIPFEEGDSISFKTTIYPEPTQKNLTGKSSIEARPYRIKLNIKEDINVNNIEPDDETFIRETNYNLSHNYNNGFVEFVMPVISSFDISSNTNTTTLIINANTFNITSIRVMAYNSNGDVLEPFSNLYIDLADQNIPAIINFIDTTDQGISVSQYESNNSIASYTFEFVTNDDLTGPAFTTYSVTNKTNGYVIT